MKLGVHVSIAGGLPEAVERAKRLSCTSMQIFSRSPRGGPAPTYPLALIRAFTRARRAYGIAPLAIHSPYVINLASPEARMWAQSVRLYREEYRRACRLNAHYLVTHVGSHRGQGDVIGIRRVALALNQTLRGTAGRVMILLENTAGAGMGLGDRFEQLAAIRRAAGTGANARIGVCLDTAHLFAAGYPIHTADGLEETLNAFDRTVGLAHLKLIHLNDSKSPFNSHVDRHWHIGQGCIGRAALGRVIRHPRLRNIPCILETPKKTEREDRRNLSIVRRLANANGRTTQAHVV